jgi:hypothetical protein
MKKLVLSALMLTVLSPAWAQAAPRRAPAQATAAESSRPALRDIAKALASTLTDPESRRLIKREVGRKFDGDHEVLYRDVANRRVGNGKAFRQALGQSLGKVQGGAPATRVAAQQRLDQLTAALPQLQIAVPVGFADWDAETAAPLVTFVPEGVDDDQLVEVEAFDAQGRSYMLDARVEPTMPVVVVGLNERTDANGYLDTDLQQATGSMMMEQPIDEYPTEPYIPYEPVDPGGDNPYEPVETVVTTPTLGICDTRPHNYGDQEIFYQIKINNDHEPWVKGDPEIYATYSFVDNQGIKGQYHMANVNNTGTWYTINGPLFYWQSYYGNTLAMAIWEKDGTNWGTFSYSFSGFTFSVQIFDGDDQLGGNPVSFFDPVCGYYSTGDAEYKMRF